MGLAERWCAALKRRRGRGADAPTTDDAGPEVRPPVSTYRVRFDGPRPSFTVPTPGGRPDRVLAYRNPAPRRCAVRAEPRRELRPPPVSIMVAGRTDVALSPTK